jgi:hypothetical protein
MMNHFYAAYYFTNLSRSHLKNTTSRVSLSLSKAIGLKKHGFDKLNLTFNLFLRWLLENKLCRWLNLITSYVCFMVV